MKVKNSNDDKNSKFKIVTKHRNSNCDNSKTQSGTQLRNSNCDKTQIETILKL